MYDVSLSSYATFQGIDKPADVTVVSGRFSRDTRKDMRNGTSESWLTAVNALWDVSLQSLSNCGAENELERDSREAP